MLIIVGQNVVQIKENFNKDKQINTFYYGDNYVPVEEIVCR